MLRRRTAGAGSGGAFGGIGGGWIGCEGTGAGWWVAFNAFTVCVKAVVGLGLAGITDICRKSHSGLEGSFFEP